MMQSMFAPEPKPDPYAMQGWGGQSSNPWGHSSEMGMGDMQGPWGGGQWGWGGPMMPNQQNPGMGWGGQWGGGLGGPRATPWFGGRR